MPAVVAQLSDLAELTPVKVEADGQPIVLIRLGDDVRALHDTCSHAQWSLSEGHCDEEGIECDLHGATFDLDTGAPKNLPATKPVPTYPVTIDGDDVRVDATTPTNGAPVPDHW